MTMIMQRRRSQRTEGIASEPRRITVRSTSFIMITVSMILLSSSSSQALVSFIPTKRRRRPALRTFPAFAFQNSYLESLQYYEPQNDDDTKEKEEYAHTTPVRMTPTSTTNSNPNEQLIPSTPPKLSQRIHAYLGNRHPQALQNIQQRWRSSSFSTKIERQSAKNHLKSWAMSGTVAYTLTTLWAILGYCQQFELEGGGGDAMMMIDWTDEQVVAAVWAEAVAYGKWAGPLRFVGSVVWGQVVNVVPNNQDRDEYDDSGVSTTITTSNRLEEESAADDSFTTHDDNDQSFVSMMTSSSSPRSNNNNDVDYDYDSNLNCWEDHAQEQEFIQACRAPLMHDDESYYHPLEAAVVEMDAGS